jgi:hypothetical protein
METNDPGSLSDALAAQRAVRRAIAPWWLAVPGVVCAGLVWASLYGAHRVGDHLLVTVVLAIAGCAITMLIERSRVVYRQHPASSPEGLSIAVVVAVGIVVATLLRHAVEPGSVSSYVVQFMAAVTTMAAGTAIARRLNARRAGR